ncbi:hypothetical protein CDD82_6481 [Ophiocordyceps australis]|uniref:Zn(2)-C6 fungal-type domain-containing protein n=1 Tax=Ophiocordyceps australis TaxID=1399860 RepID=A0A2C5YPQ5_9HYPO|nr:hypothetical protein CDD82_6481 [Ophiocordyceps australis]
MPIADEQRVTCGGLIASGGAGFINYLPRASGDYERLALLQGDADTFADIIGLIGEYEGVLERHESLAASLGAKLTGPRLLKGIEKLFDGPIRTTWSQSPSTPALSWLDVVCFAKANPGDFVLTSSDDGSRCCQFVCKGVRAEISEDDWRLISSGALDRFPLERPFEEDETAELATLDILEQRASVLYKKADEVAARARILHHKLGQRRNDLVPRPTVHQGGGRFHAANQPARPWPFNSSYDLRADLLRQFTASTWPWVPPSRSPSGATSLGPLSPSTTSPQRHHDQQQHSHSHHHHHHHQYLQKCAQRANVAAESRGPVDGGRAEAHRGLITQMTERLAKGDVINPPCDRCRRIRLQCVKHLTACQGCTKKHAKCSWKCVSQDELSRLVRLETEQEPAEAEASNSSSRAFAGLHEARLGAESDTPAREPPSRPESRAMPSPQGLGPCPRPETREEPNVLGPLPPPPRTRE